MMKRFLATILIIASLFGIGAMAAELQPISFPFVGRWQPSEDPVLLDDYGLQDIQNLRKVGKHFKAIGGHTIINATSLSDYPYFINGFHFHKDQPSESHILVVSSALTGSVSYLRENTAAIPGEGDFTSTVLHTDATGGYGTGRFSVAPNGNMVYANGPETLIWGGNEIEATAFIASSDSLSGTASIITNPQDYTDQVRNTRQTSDQVASIGSGIDSYSKLLLHGDGASGSTVITDAISTARIITSNGSVQLSTAQYKFGTASMLFASATSDFISMADDTEWDLGGGNFTIDTWVRFTSIPNTTSAGSTFTGGESGVFTVPVGVSAITVSMWGGGASGGAAQQDSGGNYQAWGGGGAGYIEGWPLTVTSGQTISYSVGSGGAAVPIPGTGGTYGNAGGTTTFGTMIAYGGGVTTSGGTATDGTHSAAGGSYVYDADAENGATYVHPQGGTLYGGGGPGAVNSTMPFTGSKGGNSKGTGAYGSSYAQDTRAGGGGASKGNGAAGVSAWNQTVSGNNGSQGSGGGGVDSAVGTSGQGGDGGIEITYTTSASTVSIISHWSTAADKAWDLNLFGTSVVNLGFQYSVDGSNVSTASVAWTPDVNTWYHLEVSRDSDNLRFFVNGTQQGSTVTFSATTIYNSTSTLKVGSNGASYLDAYIDELRLSKGIARHTDTFTPETSPYSNAPGYWFVAATRPIQGVKFYVSTPNTVVSTMAVKEWNGQSWTDLTATDNTSSSGISLGRTGTVTWSSTVNSSKPKYINGLSLYWYQFYLSMGSAKIYYATVDAPMQSIKNIWDGAKSYVSKCWKYDGTTYKDYSDAVNDDVGTTSIDVSSLSTAGYIAVGFVEPKQGIELTMVTGSENTTASTTMSMKYWSGSVWTDVAALSDATATSTTALSKSGVVSFQPVTAGLEFTRAVSDEAPLYYYKISFAAAPDDDTKIAEIRGISAPIPIGTYRFSETYQDRLFLFSEYNGDRNKAIYSMDNAPDVFNGSDSGELFFGDKTDIMAAKSVYNVLGDNAVDQMIVAKKNEIYRVTGNSPSTWDVKRISENVGCVAPLSMVACDIRGRETGGQRQVVAFQGDNGFYMTDGSVVTPISDDIRCYFDPNDSRYIPTSRRSKTVAWYDPAIRAYKVLISSGSTATYHNIELEYSLTSGEWTKIYRTDASGADPLQSGFRVFDTDGLGYTYGGNRKGFLYRLENGQTFAGTAIEQYIHTKDMILDKEAPLFRKGTIKHIRTAMKKKTNGGNVTITHYGDQVVTVSGSSNQAGPSAINMATAPYNTQSVNLGPFLYHSLKVTASASTVVDGLELTGIGLWVEPYTAIR